MHQHPFPTIRALDVAQETFVDPIHRWSRTGRHHGGSSTYGSLRDCTAFGPETVGGFQDVFLEYCTPKQQKLQPAFCVLIYACPKQKQRPFLVVRGHLYTGQQLGACAALSQPTGYCPGLNAGRHLSKNGRREIRHVFVSPHYVAARFREHHPQNLNPTW